MLLEDLLHLLDGKLDPLRGIPHVVDNHVEEDSIGHYFPLEVLVHLLHDEAIELGLAYDLLPLVTILRGFRIDMLKGAVDVPLERLNIKCLIWRLIAAAFASW